MLQDILPHKFLVKFSNKQIQMNDIVLLYYDNKVLCKFEQDMITFPTLNDIQNLVSVEEQTYNYYFLFHIDQIYFYTNKDLVVPESSEWTYFSTRQLRDVAPVWKAFAGMTGFQINRWLKNNKFCGRCGSEMGFHKTERALLCPNCKKTVYPLIMPSVIIGVTNGDSLLLTKYNKKHNPYANYALVAGYTEIGETLEDTIRREVKEEVNLTVKNIKYYKSQPWAFTDTLLVGFFCELDGSPEINLEEDELAEGTWFHRDEIPPTVSKASLTNDMIEYFRSGKPL